MHTHTHTHTHTEGSLIAWNVIVDSRENASDGDIPSHVTHHAAKQHKEVICSMLRGRIKGTVHTPPCRELHMQACPPHTHPTCREPNAAETTQQSETISVEYAAAGWQWTTADIPPSPLPPPSLVPRGSPLLHS